MAEREVYNPNTGQYELINEFLDYSVDPPPAEAPPSSSGPPYTPSNPPPPPPDGYEYILNPATGEFELRPRNQTPPAETTPTPTPTSTPTPEPGTPPTYSDGGNTDGGALGQFDSTGFEWPSYTPPAYQSAGLLTPRTSTFAPSTPTFIPSKPTFEFDPFVAPTAEQARNSPGYQAAATEARKQLEAGAAYRGTLRSGMTLGDILKQQTALGDQNYNNVFGRELEGYKTNRGNAFENWAANLNSEKSIFDTNFGAEKSIFDTNYGVDVDIFDRLAAETDKENNYRFNASQAEFAPKQRKAELTFADLYSRWRDLLNSTTQIATAGD